MLDGKLFPSSFGKAESAPSVGTGLGAGSSFESLDFGDRELVGVGVAIGNSESENLSERGNSLFGGISTDFSGVEVGGASRVGIGVAATFSF